MPTPTPSVPRQFYQDIISASDPVAAIRRLINSDPLTVESDHFDCKLEDRDPKKRDSKSKELWSKVLGGFANAGGGVVIWGLDASKREIEGRMIDAVVGEVPVHHPQALEHRLRELQRHATDPPLGDVDIRAFPLPGDETRGFVVCFIPEGSFRPYRSELAGPQYFLRAGDSTQPMPRSVLRSMFYPRLTPDFRIAVTETIRASRAEGNICLAVKTISLELLNDGTASAKDLAVWVCCADKGKPAGPQLRTSNRWVLRDEGSRWELTSSGFPIHPGQRLPLCEAVLSSRFDVSDGSWANFPAITLGVTVYCENQERRVFDLYHDGPNMMNDDESNCWESDPVG